MSVGTPRRTSKCYRSSNCHLSFVACVPPPSLNGPPSFPNISRHCSLQCCRRPGFLRDPSVRWSVPIRKFQSRLKLYKATSPQNRLSPSLRLPPSPTPCKLAKLAKLPPTLPSSNKRLPPELLRVLPTPLVLPASAPNVSSPISSSSSPLTDSLPLQSSLHLPPRKQQDPSFRRAPGPLRETRSPVSVPPFDTLCVS